MKGEIEVDNDFYTVIPKKSENDCVVIPSSGDDIEAASDSCCRICLEFHGAHDDELISPCLCKGTQQFVHRSCLDQWRSVKEGFDFSHCTTCKAQFHLRVESSENSWRKVKFRLFVTRDVLLVFLAVQTVIGAMGALAYLIDKHRALINMFDDRWDHILSKHPIPFYYCVGVVIFLAVVGFCGLIIHCLSLNSSDSQTGGSSGSQNYGYAWTCIDFSPPSSSSESGLQECCFLLILFVIILAIFGIAYGFLAATMAFQRIWQRHYHILIKRELTKEYVVVDMHGCYIPPVLDPEHVEELKMLKLL